MAAAEIRDCTVALQSLPVSALPRAEPKRKAPTARRKKQLSEKAKCAKRERDRGRARTRVNVLKSFPRWKELRVRLGFTLDSELAEHLLDSYEKFTKIAPSQIPAKPKSKCPAAPKSVKSEKSQKSHSPSSGPVLKCPACGFVLKVQNTNEPQSIEVTLENEQTEEPVSGAEEADRSNGESEEEEDESERSDVEQSNEEEEESKGSGVVQNIEEEDESVGSDVDQESSKKDSDNEWIPQLRHRAAKQREKTAKEEQSEEDEEVESEEEESEGERRKVRAVPTLKMQLCTECGEFYKKSHKCDHKEKRFACNVCGRRFVSEPALKVHSYMHSETHEFHCKFCYVSFKTKVDKIGHELIHLKQKDPFKCPHCALTFPSFRKRAAHKKEKHFDTYKCKVCGTGFADQQHFMRHVAVHTGERPFECSVCFTSFKQDSHLKSHMRLHTGERPYRCKHCPKAFNHNVCLKSHIKKYHPLEEEEKKVKEEEKSEPTVKPKSRRARTGRPRGRPKRNAEDGIQESTSRKIIKTEPEPDDYESEDDSTWSQDWIRLYTALKGAS